MVRTAPLPARRVRYGPTVDTKSSVSHALVLRRRTRSRVTSANAVRRPGTTVAYRARAFHQRGREQVNRCCATHGKHTDVLPDCRPTSTRHPPAGLRRHLPSHGAMRGQGAALRLSAPCPLQPSRGLPFGSRRALRGIEWIGSRPRIQRRTRPRVTSTTAHSTARCG